MRSPTETIEEVIQLLNLPSRLMDEKEVAQVKRCSVQTLRNHRHLGRGLPYYKEGRSVRYAPHDVAADILKSRIEPEARN